MVVSRGVSVTARQLVDQICGENGTAGAARLRHRRVLIFGTLHRDTRRYQNAIENLGLRLEDIAGLEREPAATTKTAGRSAPQLAQNGATPEEVEIMSASS
jgi:hypothetical protein